MSEHKYSKLKALGHATKEFAKKVSNPYYSIFKGTSNLTDSSMFCGPFLRNMVAIPVIETLRVTLTGKPPEVLSYYTLLLTAGSMEGFIEGDIVTLGYDYIKNRLKIK